MKFFGWVFVVLGTIFNLISFFAVTTVNGSYNIGLLSETQKYATIGSTLFISGILLISVACIIDSINRRPKEDEVNQIQK